MVASELARTDLRKKRFFKKRVDLPKWQENSQYGWLVIDRLDEMKPLKVVLGKDADIILKRLNRMHGNGVKAARPAPGQDHRACK